MSYHAKKRTPGYTGRNVITRYGIPIEFLRWIRSPRPTL